MWTAMQGCLHSRAITLCLLKPEMDGMMGTKYKLDIRSCSTVLFTMNHDLVHFHDNYIMKPSLSFSNILHVHCYKIHTHVSEGYRSLTLPPGKKNKNKNSSIFP